MGDIRIKDQVCNPDGGVSRVLLVHERGVRDIYRFTFDDGATCEAGLDHLWKVRNPRARRFRKKSITDNLEKWQIATTRQLIDRIKRKDVVIPLTVPPEFTVTARYKDGRWPVPAYALGVFLGDGHIGAENLTLASADPEIPAAIERLGFTPTSFARQRDGQCFVYRYDNGLKFSFEKLGLGGHRAWEKFIPEQYKIAPLEMRWALARGLFDTDGYADSRGHCSFTTSSEQLGLDVQWLVRSLGFKANVTTKTPSFTYKGEKRKGRLAYTVWAKGSNQEELFSLNRKRARAALPFNGGYSERSRKIVSIEPCGQAEARCITVDHPNGLYITDDFVVTHNSYVLLLSALQYVDMPGYSALLLRRTMPELMAPSSLVPLSHDLLSGGDAVWHAQRMYWSFPSGAKLSFGYCDREDDKGRYKSAAYQFIGFDELTDFSESVYTFLFSRLRKATKISDIPLRVRSASNPGGFGHNWVKQRFIVEGKKFGRVFVPARLDDNPFLDRTSYLRSLANLDAYTRSQLLDGNWDAKPPGGKFHRAWFASRIVTAGPAGMNKVRFWDLASTSPERGKDPDYTVGALMGEYDGRYYLMDLRRERNTPKNIQDLVSVTADLDDRDVMIRMEQEPGSGGVNTIDTYTRLLAKYDFKGLKSTGSKEMRANPFSAQCEAGNVYLVKGDWMNDFFDEAELFPHGAHDDIVDACSGAYLVLAEMQSTSTLDDILVVGNVQKPVW
jgi:predicted phage terminase large subunit-like protein